MHWFMCLPKVSLTASQENIYFITTPFSFYYLLLLFLRSFNPQREEFNLAIFSFLVDLPNCISHASTHVMARLADAISICFAKTGSLFSININQNNIRSILLSFLFENGG